MTNTKIPTTIPTNTPTTIQMAAATTKSGINHHRRQRLSSWILVIILSICDRLDVVSISRVHAYKNNNVVQHRQQRGGEEEKLRVPNSYFYMDFAASLVWFLRNANSGTVFS